jgi:hypothetical protein
MWLTASGNGRYFIPMACVAAVLAIALLFRLCARFPKLRNYLLLAVFCAQFYQLHAGAEYPNRVPWGTGPYFQLSVPRALATERTLYFNIGVQSNSFIAPYLAPGSGLINLEGTYTLGPQGANGAHIESLVRRYAPNLRVLVRDKRLDAGRLSSFPNPINTNDALEPFGLQLDTSRCTRIIARGITSSPIRTVAGRAPTHVSAAEFDTGYFITCRVVKLTSVDPALVAGERTANLVLDRLEDACPALLQPRRPATYILQDKHQQYIWARQYSNTDMAAWVKGGWVYFQRLIGGGKLGYAGKESAWEKSRLPVVCGRGSNGYFLRVLRPR